MNLKKNGIAYIYLLLALAGATLTWMSNIEFMRIYGPMFDVKQFIDLANVNPAAQSLSRDLLISSSAISIWIYLEAKRLEMKNYWFILISTFFIAIAFSAPFFLFLRERRMLEIDKQLV